MEEDYDYELIDILLEKIRSRMVLVRAAVQDIDDGFRMQRMGFTAYEEEVTLEI